MLLKGFYLVTIQIYYFCTWPLKELVVKKVTINKLYCVYNCLHTGANFKKLPGNRYYNNASRLMLGY